MIRRFTPRGLVTATQAIEYLGLRKRKPAGHAARQAWLVDLSQADINVNTHAELADFGTLVAESATQCQLQACRINVVTQDSHTLGLLNVIRVYAMQTDGVVTVATSDTVEAAEAWLGPA